MSTGSSSVEKTAPAVVMRWDVRIPLRDGEGLSATAYFPECQRGPAPAIFVLTPYVRQTHHDEGIYFASHGYPFLTVDVRGRGGSDGEFHPRHEAGTDGHDIVEWIAEQTFCNGKVAMWGGSYSGYVQWIAAKDRPPHLATIVPVASPYRGVDGPMRNNIFASYRIRWLTLLAGRTSQEKIFADQPFWASQFRRWFEAGLPFKALDSVVGVPSKIFHEWLAHPEPDAYWDRHNPNAEQYANIDLPILTITGAYDGNQAGALRHYHEHVNHASIQARARHYLVIGPWDHAGTRAPKAEFAGLKVDQASLLDLGKLHREWYAWTMQGGAKPEFLKNNVAYYVTGAERWRYADTLNDVTGLTKPFYLHADGRLQAEPPGRGEADQYVYDPRDVSLAELESTIDPASLTDQRLQHARMGKQLVYHSMPFGEDTEISGFFRLTAWLSIDQPDTDFIVSIHEIDCKGDSLFLSNDILRARYRESLRQAQLITTREPLRYGFERFTFVSRLVRRGHRLRLVFGSINSIFSEKNYNSGGVVSEESMQDGRIVTVRLFHDAAHPSALYVPYCKAETSNAN
jgi:uncharacterized protein